MRYFRLFALFSILVTVSGCKGIIPNNMACTADAQCVSGDCGDDGFCKGKADGASCTQPAECEHGICPPDKNVCQPAPTVSCTTPGWELVDGRCLPPLSYTGLPYNSPCRVDANCKSETCLSGSCGGLANNSACTENRFCATDYCDPQSSSCQYPQVVNPPTTTDGPTLYAQYCASCHGQLSASTKKNRTASQIQEAISTNVGGMGALSQLTAGQITAIAGALVFSTPNTCLPACSTWQVCQNPSVGVYYCSDRSDIPDGQACTTNNQCLNKNCVGATGSVSGTCQAPVVSGLKDIDQSCTANTECHSGTCLSTGKCAPDRFWVCIERGGSIDFYGNGSIPTRPRVYSSGVCVSSDPSLDERSAVMIGTTTGCTQKTFWVPQGVSCTAGINRSTAVWNTGRIYPR